MERVIIKMGLSRRFDTSFFPDEKSYQRGVQGSRQRRRDTNRQPNQPDNAESPPSVFFHASVSAGLLLLFFYRFSSLYHSPLSDSVTKGGGTNETGDRYPPI